MRRPLGLVSVVAALGFAYLGWTFFKPPEQASGPMPSEPVSLQAPELRPEAGTAAKPGDPQAGEASADAPTAPGAVLESDAGSDAGSDVGSDAGAQRLARSA